MSASTDFVDHVLELLAGLGTVHARRMFGGAGLSLDGITFAIVADETLWLRADETSKAAFEAEHCEPFGYDTKDGRRVVMSYWRAPERLLDEPDELVQWSRTALGVARNAAAAKPARKPRQAAAAKSPRKRRPATAADKSRR